MQWGVRMDEQEQQRKRRFNNSTAYYGQVYWNRLSSAQEIDHKKKLAFSLAIGHAGDALLNNASLIYVSEQTKETDNWRSAYTITVEVEVLKVKG